jgi:TonB family protein
MRYFRALILSLAFHAIALLLFWLLAGTNPTHLTPQNSTVVELMETPDLAQRPHQIPKDEKLFVRKAEVPPELRAKEKRPARFASENEQWVLQEQQARQSGMTANRSATIGSVDSHAHGLQPKAKRDADRTLNFKPDSPFQKFAEREFTSSNDGDVEMSSQKKRIVNSYRPLDLSRFGSVERGQSTFGEKAPDDIKFGDFTALNTDRQLYYSFYSRMEEMIRGRWVNYARAVVYGIENGSEKVSGHATYTTQLEVILDKEGTFSRAILHSSSGSRGLDSAPVQAFRDAQQFPHPPPEMVKEDGTIHIYYAFSVSMVPRYAAHDAEDE